MKEFLRIEFSPKNKRSKVWLCDFASERFAVNSHESRLMVRNNSKIYPTSPKYVTQYGRSV